MMQPKTLFIKDDLNFLENPNWIVSTRDHAHVTSLKIHRENGYYEIKNPEGMPVRFDKLVLYFLLHKLFKSGNPEDREVITTRYEIAKNILNQEKNFSTTKYARIMLALKKWKAIYIKFEGIFLEENHQVIKYFSIIDSVTLNKETNDLSVVFNDNYIRQLHESKFYNVINFNEYKMLTRPVAMRLYEVLNRYLLTKNNWYTSKDDLGEILTLEKRDYASQIIAAVEPALDEINMQTSLKISMKYYKEENLFIFKKMVPPGKKQPTLN